MAPKGKKWTQEEILNFDDEDDTPSYIPMNIGGGTRGGRTSNRKSRSRALSRKRVSKSKDRDSRPVAHGSDAEGESDSDLDHVARDYASNLNAFGLLTGNKGGSSSDDEGGDGMRVEKEETTIPGLFVDTQPQSVEATLAGAAAALQPPPASPVRPFPTVGAVGEGQLRIQYPPIENMIRDPARHHDEFRDSDDDDEEDDMSGSRGHMIRGDSISSGSRSDLIDSEESDESESDDDSEQDEEEEEDDEEDNLDDDDEALFQKLLETRRKAMKASAQRAGPSGSSGPLPPPTDAMEGSEWDEEEDEEDVVNKVKPTKNTAKKRKRAKGPSDLLPGEKKKLRKEGIKAKRAARAAANGFDLTFVNEELEAFVHEGMDIKAFPPMGKHELKVVQRLASLYGLKSTIQGSGKKRFILIQNTKRSTIPAGEAAAEVRLMLTLQEARQAMGAQGGGSLEERQALARLAGVRGVSASTSAVKMARGGAGSGRQIQHHPKKADPQMTVPLASRFIAAGTLIDASEPDAPTVHMPPNYKPPTALPEVLPSAEAEGDDAMGAGPSVAARGKNHEPLMSPGGRVQEFNRWQATHQVATSSNHGEKGSGGVAPSRFKPDTLRDTTTDPSTQQQEVLYDRISSMALGLPMDTMQADDGEGNERAGLGMAMGLGFRPASDSPAFLLQDLPSTSDARARDGDDLIRPPKEMFPFAPNRKPSLVSAGGSGSSKKGKKGKDKKGRDKDKARASDLAMLGLGQKDTVDKGKHHNSLAAATAIGFGGWEKHTSGVGSKLMEKMGFDGRGLGRNRDGRVDPIMPEMRAKRQGLGTE